MKNENKVTIKTRKIMIHKFSRYLLTLVALLALTAGAWATEEYESFDLSSGNTNVNGTHFNITGTSGMNDYGLFLSSESVTVTSLNGENITRVEFIIGLGKSKAENITGTPGTNSCTNGNENGSITDINATSVTLSTENSGYTSVSIKQITVYYGNSAPAVEVTTNAASEGATFTEAWFNMPAFDATAEYELVRDMSVQMTAQVGDGTQEQPRYRVKKDGNNKFIPADMEMAAVPALFTVNDAIEQKALTQTQDYIVQIYAIDAEGQPTGEAMTFATFTFEPGIYAVKAVAAQGSDYDGETALSNTFTLAEAYDLTLSPATNANLKSVTVGGTAKTADEKGVIKNIEPGKKVKITTTGPDYIIRKATVKKTVNTVTITVEDVTLDITGCATWVDVVDKNSDKIECPGNGVKKKGTSYFLTYKSGDTRVNKTENVKADVEYYWKLGD